jgi:hypothetical protein
MTGATQPGASTGVVVYVDHSAIDLSRVDELRSRIRRVVSFIEAEEPQLIAYGFHIDEVRGRMTVTAVHPDSASLELHMEVGRDAFRTLSDLITLTGVEVYGAISERARTMLEQKVQMLGAGDVVVTDQFAGFARHQRPAETTPPVAER